MIERIKEFVKTRTGTPVVAERLVVSYEEFLRVKDELERLKDELEKLKRENQKLKQENERLRESMNIKPQEIEIPCPNCRYGRLVKVYYPTEDGWRKAGYVCFWCKSFERHL